MEDQDKVSQLSYGPVLIVKGAYRGRAGFYDDDVDEGTALVWLVNHMATTVTVDIRFLVSLAGLPGKWVRNEMVQERRLRKERPWEMVTKDLRDFPGTESKKK